jgi:hypothetical protein
MPSVRLLNDQFSHDFQYVLALTRYEFIAKGTTVDKQPLQYLDDILCAVIERAQSMAKPSRVYSSKYCPRELRSEFHWL